MMEMLQGLSCLLFNCCWIDQDHVFILPLPFFWGRGDNKRGNAVTMKKIPLGIHSLDKMVNQNCVYVDKTPIAWQLIRQPGAFFMSRPRRFGKSLFVDTLKEIFEGNKALFKGLYIHDKWDWSQTWPVIKIDFSDGTLQTRESLDRRIYEILFDNAARLSVTLSKGRDIPGTFGELIRFSEKKYSARAVVLVDEYDKPILDNIEDPDIAKEMREGLKNLYSVLKGQDAHLQFVFMTGSDKVLQSESLQWGESTHGYHGA